MEIILLLATLLLSLALFPCFMALLARQFGARRGSLSRCLLLAILIVVLGLALLGVGIFLGYPLITALITVVCISALCAWFLQLSALRATGVYVLGLTASLIIGLLLFFALGLIYGIHDITGLPDRLSAELSSTSVSTTAPSIETPRVSSSISDLDILVTQLCGCGSQQDCLRDHYHSFLQAINNIDETQLDDSQISRVDEAQARATQCFFQPTGG